MSATTSPSSKRLRVLLTNDDGPPGKHSPYIFGLYKHLTQDLGWDVRVVVPSSQKSWIGKAHQIHEIIKGKYYYPKDPDGAGEVSVAPRPLKEGEIGEWVLLDATPATCANIALHNLYHEEIDLLISGPNLGRNSSAAFALSSGTIGAALSSSLSKIRSIALSYGIVQHPTPPEYSEPAHLLSSRIIRHLWDNWGEDAGGLRNGEVDLYNINIPLVTELLNEEGLRICWTHIWRNTYGRLFSPHQIPKATIFPGGPEETLETNSQGKSGDAEEEEHQLVFKFAPDMTGILSAKQSPVGSDGWAIAQGWASVTPMRASFAEPDGTFEEIVVEDIDKRIWKLKL
ncbi:putative tubulin-tyrosine ligase [Abortiporus biennis]